MAQNITLMGASYSDVPAVQLPKTGGGTALFSDPSITTAIASDVASGKTFLLADGSIGTGTASGGGGGASNIVTGTFKGTTTGAAMEVNLAYTGSGYPIGVLIYPTGGQDGSTLAQLVQRYVTAQFYGSKLNTTTAPVYTGNVAANQFVVFNRYKGSATSATTYSTSSTGSAATANGSDAANSINNVVRFKSNKKLSVYIASSSYGFAANIEYTYHVIYSS